MWEIPSFSELEKSLGNPKNPIGMRMRAAYYLRQVHSNEVERQKDVVRVLAKGLHEVQHGSLMRHEFAYVMGQLRDKRCCDSLEEVLQDTSDCVMVRHEAAEALGAIGAPRSESILTSVREANPDLPEISDTCQLALNIMEWRAAGEDPENVPAVCACMLNPYSTVDPAPPHPAHQDKSFEELGDILCDAELPLFERYRAMFSLRNRGGELSVLQLCRTLTRDTSSPLLRHEVAYVLGQMQHPASVEALEEVLKRRDEHVMVRHESAEALGAIDGRWEDVEKILQEFANDHSDIDAVRESCLVALDAADYWGRSDEVQPGSATDDEEVRLSFAQHKADDGNILANHFNIAQVS